jgi:uncharacterized membrane protein YdjX (TVP38/TMEM64 family)
MWKWAAAGVLLALLAAGAALLPLKEWLVLLERTIEGFGLVFGLLAFSALYFLASLILIPGWIFPLAAGAVFGFGWGLAASAASALLSAVAAFLIARYLLRGPLQKAAHKNATFKAIDQAVARQAWQVVALVRMSPLMPSGIKSYFLGLTRIRLPDYAAASLAGMLPGLLLKVWIGSAGRDAVVHGDPLSWTLFGAGIAATLALTFIVGRKVRKKLAL